MKKVGFAKHLLKQIDLNILREVSPDKIDKYLLDVRAKNVIESNIQIKLQMITKLKMLKKLHKYNKSLVYGDINFEQPFHPISQSENCRNWFNQKNSIVSDINRLEKIYFLNNKLYLAHLKHDKFKKILQSTYPTIDYMKNISSKLETQSLESNTNIKSLE